jgi:hypothetical protein
MSEQFQINVRENRRGTQDKDKQSKKHNTICVGLQIPFVKL